MISDLFRRKVFICRGAIIDFPLSDFEESVRDSSQRELSQKIGSRATFSEQSFAFSPEPLEPLTQPLAYSTDPDCPRWDQWFPPFGSAPVGGGEKNIVIADNALFIQEQGEACLFSKNSTTQVSKQLQRKINHMLTCAVPLKKNE